MWSPVPLSRIVPWFFERIAYVAVAAVERIVSCRPSSTAAVVSRNLLLAESMSPMLLNGTGGLLMPPLGASALHAGAILRPCRS